MQIYLSCPLQFLQCTEHQEHHSRESLLENSVGSGAAAAAHPTPAASLSPSSKAAPCALLPGRGTKWEKLRQKQSQEDVSCPWGVSDALPQIEGGGCPCSESCSAGAASACRAPFKVSHLSRDQLPDPGRVSILYCLEKSKFTGERAGQGAANHKSFLVPFSQEIDCLLQMPAGRDRILF